MSGQTKKLRRVDGPRTRAETDRKRVKKVPASDLPSDTFGVDTRRLLQELQVHQVELETQNADLAESRDQVALLLAKFTDLYDFAPIGYFSLDQNARVLEVNLTGASLLGLDRSALLKRSFTGFVERAGRPAFHAFLAHLFSEAEVQSCEVRLLNPDGTAFWAGLHGGSEPTPNPSGKTCRIAVSDITSLKLAQEAHQRAESLSASNDALQREIISRQAVEEALKKSGQHQLRLLAKAAIMQAQLRKLAHRIIETREDERRRISRELHDDITQTLVGINVNLETLSREAAIHPSGIHRKIIQTQRGVEKAVRIVHDYACELRPSSLDDLGLIVTLHAHLNAFMARTGVRVRFHTLAEVDKVDRRSRTAFFRIVQEALVNIDKHAGARHVEVNIRRVADSLQLEIVNDGKSFDVDRKMNTGKGRRLGLIGMREQAEMAGGTLTIESNPELGTKVLVTLPFKNAAGGHSRT